MHKPQIQSQSTLWSGFFQLKQDILQNCEGQLLPYSFVSLTQDAAVILAKDTEGRWILNREYRHPTGDSVLGCPGGRIEPEEPAQEAALRELLEETGYQATTLIPIGCIFPLPALCNQTIHFFYAPCAIKIQETDQEPFEYIRLELKSEEELQEEFTKGSPMDGILCSALCHYMRYQQQQLAYQEPNLN